MTNRRVTDDYTDWLVTKGLGRHDETVKRGFEAGFNYGREYGLELAEDALDAANAKLAHDT